VHTGFILAKFSIQTPSFSRRLICAGESTGWACNTDYVASLPSFIESADTLGLIVAPDEFVLGVIRTLTIRELHKDVETPRIPIREDLEQRLYRVQKEADSKI
jgi:hypothetical protein